MRIYGRTGISVTPYKSDKIFYAQNHCFLKVIIVHLQQNNKI